MTAQIGDSFKFKDRKYSIVAISEPIKFDPKMFGITPQWVSTACWNGYWCEYDITEEGIFLENLYIKSKNDFYPEINGVLPMCEGETGEMDKYMGHHLYKGVHLKMDYEGRILVGTEFLQEYYIHMGYQRAWAYKVLKEFVFLDGELVEINDLSEVAQEMRNRIDQDKNFWDKLHSDILKFINDSFSLDYEEKLWWI